MPSVDKRMVGPACSSRKIDARPELYPRGSLLCGGGGERQPSIALVENTAGEATDYSVSNEF